MKRRQFIKQAATTSIGLSTSINGFGLRALAALPFLKPTDNLTDTDHVLVLINLAGGNDGINTVIPFDQYNKLTSARPYVLLNENELLSLNGYDATKLHPKMQGMQQLFNEGKMQIIQSVGYPNPDFSHFRSTDIWMSASDSDQVVNTGWVGRYLNYEYPNFPVDYPNVNMPHPLSIEFSSSPSLALQSPTSNMAFTINDPEYIYNLASGSQQPAPNTPAGEQLTHIRIVAQQSRQYSQVVANIYNNTTALSDNLDTALAEQLRITARLIKGGLKTRIYLLHLDGFDTHASQVESSNHSEGTHAFLLQTLSDAVAAFQQHLTTLGIAQRVTTMTFSEFGRRIISNFSLGTDHGTAAPLFIIGENVQGGILGSNPFIPNNTSVDDNIPMQYDFRSVYNTLLKDWFCVPEQDLPISMLQNFPTLPIFNSGTSCISSSVHDYNVKGGTVLVRPYPNPFVTSISIEFLSLGGFTTVQIFNTHGRNIRTLAQGNFPQGTHTVTFDSEDLPAGIYYVRLQNLSLQQVKPIIKAR
ncbi:MAG: DUF1501 domain-containing protein [Saprospiraceae bacterium]|nr:DUF1501 domain-containing protein [Saprospiraceae bacterium]MBP7699645.1 DUF1501 domain-containing protein [Saprospiraceae bacterium]